MNSSKLLDNRQIHPLFSPWFRRNDVMVLDNLAKRLYPRLPTGRRQYQFRVLLSAIAFGVLLGGVVVALIYWMYRTSK
jgi:hypothetical protein